MSEALQVTSRNAGEIRALVKAELDQASIAFSAQYVGQTKRDKWDCDAWRVSLSGYAQGFGPNDTHPKRNTLETDYFTGLGHRSKPRFPQGHALHIPGKPQTPSAADVLYSLLSDAEAASESFNEWCSNLGYDSDSIKALGTYQACCKIGEELRRILPAKVRERLQELLRDY